MTRLGKILEGKSKAADKIVAVEKERNGRISIIKGTIEDLMEYFSYTFDVANDYGLKKKNPKTINAFVTYLNQAARKAAANGNPTNSYSVGDPNDPRAVDAF